MRRSLTIAGAMLVAGCSAEQRVGNGATADINAAAEAAQGDIDTYAANTLEPAVPEAVAPVTAPPPAAARAIAAAQSPPATPTVEPKPSPTPSDTSYRCSGETRVSVRFDDDTGTATIRRDGRDVATREGQRPASGIWYKGGGYELRGEDGAANYTAPGSPPVACSTDKPPAQ